MCELQDAAKWRRYEELKQARLRHNALLREVKLMVVAPLSDLVSTLRSRRLSSVDLSTYPEKTWLEERKREMNALDCQIEALETQLKIDGMEPAVLDALRELR